MRSLHRERVARRAALGLLVVVLLVAGWLAFGGRDAYTVSFRFTDGGQLVQGGLVEVAGVKIGTIKKISMTDDGQADVEAEITDDRFTPFRRGTKATIRAVGQATLTNRYIALTLPADDAPELPSGSVIGQDATTPIVDLDAILSSATPEVRADLRALFSRGAELYAGSGSKDLNRLLERLNPALAQTNELFGELAEDRRTLARLLETSATTAQAVAARSADVRSAVRGSAVAFGALADEREALSRSLVRAPAVLRQAGSTLQAAAGTVSEIRPTLRALPAAQPSLQATLRRLPPTFRELTPAVNRLVAVLPATKRTFDAVPPLEQPLTSAVVDLGAGMKAADPILEGARYYGTDFLIGVLNGLLGVSSGGYNNQGHFAKLSFVQSPQSLLGGALSNLLPALRPVLGGLVPNVFNATEAAKARCPGGSAPPAPDGSNPWLPREGLCDPTQSMSALVNSPTARCFDSSKCEGDKRSLKFDLPARDPQDDGGVSAAKKVGGGLAAYEKLKEARK